MKYDSTSSEKCKTVKFTNIYHHSVAVMIAHIQECSQQMYCAELLYFYSVLMD